MSDLQKAAILLELLESSSDDSDDELFRMVVSKISNDEKKNNYMNQSCDAKEFFKQYRVKKQTSDYLIEQFEKSNFSLQNSDTLNSGICILSFLWFCGNDCCIGDVSSKFKISESSFMRISDSVIDFFNDLAPTVICFPESQQRMEKIASDFKQIAQFPNVIGCIGTTKIPIRVSQKMNGNENYLILQGICNVNKQFLDVFTGISGNIDDARAFQLSYISHDIEDICEWGRWHLLGNEGYPLSTYLLTPYNESESLTLKQRNYNISLKSTRHEISSVFNLLKSRFVQLRNTNFFTVEKISKFVIAVCVLHNLCIELNDFWIENLEEDASFYVVHRNNTSDSLYLMGVEKRNEICENLSIIEDIEKGD